MTAQMDEEKDIFAEYSYGKVALKKMGPQPDGFRLYSAGWIGDYHTTDTMEVKGAVFRRARAGKNKGKRCILVKGTERTAYVTTGETADFEKQDKSK